MSLAKSFLHSESERKAFLAEKNVERFCLLPKRLYPLIALALKLALSTL
jgi:hypothetical protein